MTRKVAAKTSKINRTTPGLSSHSTLERYCRDLDGWPRSWMVWEKDLPPGQQLVSCFRPFLEHLVLSDLSPKTIQKHVDNIWALGGEIIRDLNENPSLRRKNVERILADAIDEEGGPLLSGSASEEQQRSFDSTCRKLYQFLAEPAH